MPSTKIDIDTSDIPINEPYQGTHLSNESFDFEMLRQMLGKHFISQDIVTKEDRKAFNYTTRDFIWFNSRWHEACYFKFNYKWTTVIL